MVGCMEEAKIAANANTLNLPDGWSFLGSGQSRIALLSPSEVVYKLADYPSQNESEMYNLDRLAKLEMLPGWRLPKASVYRISNEVVIIAMEYIKGRHDWNCYSARCVGCNETPCAYIKRTDFGLEYELLDIHHENVIIESNGTRVPVDLGM